MKFDLEARIRRWKKSLFVLRGLEPEHIEELADHLRSDIETFIRNGKSEKEAFQMAVRNLRHIRESSRYSLKLRSNSSLLVQNLRFFFKLLLRNKTQTLHSGLGLVIGITVCMLSFFYGYHELSYDTFHDKSDQLFRVRNDVQLVESGDFQTRRATSFYAARSALKQEVPEVLDATHVYEEASVILDEPDKHTIDKGLYTDASFFRMFSVKIMQGSLDNFDTPDAVFISSSLAEKIFGHANPIGQPLEYVGLRSAANFNLVVRGVYEDIPDNSYFRNTDIFLSKIILENYNRPTLRWAPVTIEQVKWRWVDFYTFVELRKGVDAQSVNEKIQEVYDLNRREFDKSAGRRNVVVMEPVSEINLVTGLHNELESGVNKDVLWLFFGIGSLVMLIALINYVNMATATSIRRAKEIGIKKAFGAQKNQLIRQFLMESVLMTSLALFVSFLLVFLFAGFISEFLGTGITLDENDVRFFLTLSATLIGCSLLAGLYPAIILSSYQTLDVLKSASKNNRTGTLVRKILMIFQFAVVAFLLSGSLVVYKQFDFMFNKELGFSIDHKISIELPTYAFRGDDFSVKVDRFKTEALNLPNTSSSTLPGDGNNWRHTLSVDGVDKDKLVMFDRISVGDQYLQSFSYPLLAGRYFDPNIGTDYTQSLILNRTGAQSLGFTPEAAIGKSVTFPVGPEDFRIIGVVEDFHHRSMHSLIEPISLQFDSLHGGSHLIVNYQENAINVLGELEEKFSAIFPESPFKYHLLNERFMKQYESDKKFQDIFRGVTVISILLAISGLLSLSTYFLNERRKTISVRKVLGATKGELLRHILKDYVIMVSIAGVLSIPLSWQAVNSWLEGFVFRVEMSPFTFVVTLVILAVIVFLTIIQNTLKLVRVNPAKHLRND